ncbi:hypothetical protein Dsin_001630 [Dipteronia sinensis]|uniref:Cation/H+ exchanger domain-containing protein n=1 Tax=Dipteronia sinensis TaxID=43782 RepID=A0AAE0EIY2_9ROSI|nr:hypothetical protein Dsin_001630 [Dipteronia sinensis]
MSAFINGSNSTDSLEQFQEWLHRDLTVCEVYRGKKFQTRGIWFGEDPTNYVFSLFMLRIALSFCISRLLYFVFRPLKLPKSVCDMLAGIIMGPSVLGSEKKIMDKIFEPKSLLFSRSVSTMGTIYFVFITSVKMDKSRILLRAKKVWNVSVTCFFVPFIISFTLLCLLKNYLSGIIKGNMIYLIYISIAKSISHYPAISHALGELKLLNSELGNLALSAVMLHEILGGLLVATSSLVIPGNKKKAIISQFYLVVLIIFLVFVLRPLMKWIIRTTPEGKPVKGVYIKLILIAPLITGILSDLLGATFYTGAQMMGLIIPAGPPLGSALVEKSELIMSQLLLPFFYIQIGQYTNMQAIKDWTAFWTIMFILITVSLARVAGSLLSLLCFNAGLRNAFLLGVIMEIKGVIELNVYLYWRVQQFVDDSYFAAFVLALIAINAVATPLIQIFYKRETSLDARSVAESHLRTVQSARPIGQFRVLCCIHVEDNVNGMITLLKASNPTEISPICAYTLHLKQLIGRSAPSFSPLREPKKESSNEFYRSNHACFIENLECSDHHSTVDVPFPESLEFHGKTAILRSLNINIQTYAPCTVGIFVDRSARHHRSTTHFSYNVVVFFFGGPDDREALALALRMSGHPGVGITMIRIDYIPDTEEDNENERHLDEALINEFKSSSIGNACVVCHEVVVAEETMQVMNAIRSVDNNYDLVIVGKRRGPNSLLAKEMSPWIVYKELGVIGDMVASSDFCGGTLSVLVMHCVGVLGDYDNGTSKPGTEFSLSNSFERSHFSFPPSNCDVDKDTKSLVADYKRNSTFCTEV